MWGVGTEGLIGALLTGLMVLLFLRDWRSVIVVVLNIPLALAAAAFALRCVVSLPSGALSFRVPSGGDGESDVVVSLPSRRERRASA